VVGIMDREGGLMREEGFSLEEIRQLMINRKGNKLVAEQMLNAQELNARIWDMDFEIFIPAAASRLITREQVDRMIASHLEVFSCGANVPFADPEIFFGPTGMFADNNFSVIPDFIANCGMARVFAYFMENEVDMEDGAIFQDVSEIIRKALEKTYAKNPSKTGIAQTSFEIALRQLI
jgi:glutamate dehydrogenase/leucine dehydrogenase